MAWFLYDNGLRHERVKYELLNCLTPFCGAGTYRVQICFNFNCILIVNFEWHAVDFHQKNDEFEFYSITLVLKSHQIAK